MTVQLGMESNEAAGPVVDRCPYSRAFTSAFADDPGCPAYQPATFTAVDTAHRPLRSGLTCRHLTVGNDPRREGRFYPRCGLGDRAQRLRRLGSALVDRQRPGTDPQGSRGLWLANQLCDLVQLRSSAIGTTVRLHMQVA